MTLQMFLSRVFRVLCGIRYAVAIVIIREFKSMEVAHKQKTMQLVVS